ncbi:MAG: hypothetical protein L6Q78_14165 [Bacteroidia bacterium]|nr:hypothetical protein [Bacteroidia bacterium]
MIAQVQGTGISTEQQKKNWLINWYFENDPMGSIYLATLRNPALVASYQTSPGMFYGTPFCNRVGELISAIRISCKLAILEYLWYFWV